MCYLPSALTVFVVVCSRPSHCLPVTFPPSSVSGPSDCHSCVCLPDCVTCLPVYTPSPSVPGPSSSRSLLCAFIPGLVSSCPLFLSTPLGIGPRWFPARFVHSVQTCLLSAHYWGPSSPEVGISGVIHRSQCRLTTCVVVRSVVSVGILLVSLSLLSAYYLFVLSCSDHCYL